MSARSRPGPGPLDPGAPSGDGTAEALRVEAHRAMTAGQWRRALHRYGLLAKVEPDRPEWRQREAECLRRLGRIPEAIARLEDAERLYEQRGFETKAAAVARSILYLDPRNVSAQQRLMVRSTPSGGVSMKEVEAYMVARVPLARVAVRPPAPTPEPEPPVEKVHVEVGSLEPEEERRGKRIVYRTGARLTLAEQRHDAWTRDLAPHGLGILTEGTLPRRSLVEVHLDLPDGSVVELEANVRWVGEGLVGVRFVHPPDERYYALLLAVGQR